MQRVLSWQCERQSDIERGVLPWIVVERGWSTFVDALYNTVGLNRERVLENWQKPPLSRIGMILPPSSCKIIALRSEISSVVES